MSTRLPRTLMAELQQWVDATLQIDRPAIDDLNSVLAATRRSPRPGTQANRAADTISGERLTRDCEPVPAP